MRVRIAGASKNCSFATSALQISKDDARKEIPVMGHMQANKQKIRGESTRWWRGKKRDGMPLYAGT